MNQQRSKARDLPTIASFWYGSDLSWLESVCIKSYLDCGHRFVLYTAEPLTGIPQGCEVRAASDILWPPPFQMGKDDRLRVAVFSDIFRLHLVQKTNCIWVDLDAICVRAFDFPSPFVFSRDAQNTIPNGVLGLPQTSVTLQRLVDFVSTPNPTQPWRGAPLQRKNKQRIEAGETWGIEALPWGCSGPKAFGHFLKETGEDRHALPSPTFYPLTPQELWKLHDPRTDVAEIERDGVYSVHVYGHQKRNIAQTMGGLPVPNSYLDHLCRRHRISPGDNPVERLGWMQ